MTDALECRYTFLIRGTIQGANTAREAVKLYEDLRDESDEGASTWPTPALYRDGKVIGWFSYNGRVWANKVRQPGSDSLIVGDL